MLVFPNSLAAYGQDHFNAVMKAEIEALDGRELPLQQALQRSNHAVSSGFVASIFRVEDTVQAILVKVGISFIGRIMGCACTDETPVSDLYEYAMLRLTIDKQTAQASVTLLDDDIE